MLSPFSNFQWRRAVFCTRLAYDIYIIIKTLGSWYDPVNKIQGHKNGDWCLLKADVFFIF